MDDRLPWHDIQWRQLQNRHNSNQMPHALLLTGPAGLGKGLFSRRLARALLCEAQDNLGDSCGLCRSCQLFQAYSHPDCISVEPVEEGKVIGIDQIRFLCTFLSLTAQYGGYKIALLDPADRLTTNAANCLLKTLEEPPRNCLLLLVTDQPMSLPSTVRSRCQRICFESPAATIAIPWLRDHISRDVTADVVLQCAGGAPLAGLNFSQRLRWHRRLQLAECHDQAMSGQIDPIQAAANWLQGDLVENLRWLISWQQDMIRLKMHPTSPYLINPDMHSKLSHWANRKSPQSLFGRLDAAIQLHTLCATSQINPQWLLEAFFWESINESINYD